MLSLEFIERLKANYPKLNAKGVPLSEEQQKFARHGGSKNHPIDISKAFEKHFKNDPKARLRSLIKTALSK